MESSSIAPQKREVNSPEVWRVSVAPAARRASGGRCGPQQPTDRLRLNGFPQPLAAAEWQLKGLSSPKGAAELGAPLWVRCSALKAAHRTPRLCTHRPSGRERRPRKLHIPRSGASAAAHSFCCSSFSHANRFAYVRAGTLLTLSKRMRRARWKRKAPAGLIGRLRSQRPAKAGVEFAGGMMGIGGLFCAARV